MALEPRRLYVDVQARQFVVSPDSTLPSFDPVWFEEDIEAIELYFLRSTGNPVQPYEFIDLSGATVKFAVGITAPAALASSWSPIDTAVSASVSTLVEGATGTSEQQSLSFSGAIPAQGGYAIQFPARSVNVSSVAAGVFAAVAHGFCDNQEVTLSGFTISGATFANANYFVVESTDNAFSISSTPDGAAIIEAVATSGGQASIQPITTGQIAYNASAQDVELAITEAGISVLNTSPITVTGSSRSGFVFVYAGRMNNRNYAPLSVVGSTLAGAKGLATNVSFDTIEIAALIAAGLTNVQLEVEVSQGASRQTFRRPATLSGDIITSGSPIPVPPVLASSFNLQSQDGTIWVISMTNDGNLEWAPIP